MRAACRQDDVKVLGVPMEDTVSFRPGTRFAPAKIRQVLPYLEYTTHLGNPAQLPCDMGDVELLRGDVEGNLRRIGEALARLDQPWILIGGEHTLTLAALRSVRPDTYVHIDAHLDLRDQWPPGQRLSHATFARRAHEELGFYAIYIGARAYDDEELGYARENGFMVLGETPTRLEVADALSTASGRIYVSLDVDVLDPAEAPGVGTPEAGGMAYGLLEKIYIDVLLALRPRAVDIVEYSPPNDVSDVTAVKVARLLLTAASLV